MKLASLIAAVPFLSLVACVASRGDEAVQPGASALYGGTADTSSGVGLLVVRDKNDTILRSCTATLIDSTHVATAAECGGVEIDPAGSSECSQLAGCCQARENPFLRLGCSFAYATKLEDICKSAKNAICSGEQVADAETRMDVTFAADPTTASWIHVSGVTQSAQIQGVSTLLVFALDKEAPVKPLPIALDHLPPSASWSSGRLVGYGATDLLGTVGESLDTMTSLGHAEGTPHLRNTVVGSIAALDATTITVSLPAVNGLPGMLDVGGPFIMKINDIDTVVAIGASTSRGAGRFVYARTDALGAQLDVSSTGASGDKQATP